MAICALAVCACGESGDAGTEIRSSGGVGATSQSGAGGTGARSGGAGGTLAGGAGIGGSLAGNAGTNASGAGGTAGSGGVGGEPGGGGSNLGGTAGSGGQGVGGDGGGGGSAGSSSCELDIVLAVDTAPDMFEELVRLEEAMPRFFGQLSAGGADFHVVLISPRNTASFFDPGMCLGEYFGNFAGCLSGPLDPSVPPEYLQQQVSLRAGDLLDPLPPLAAEWQAYLRPGTFRPIIAISDSDESSNRTATDVLGEIEGLSSTGTWVLHSVSPEDVCFGAVGGSQNWHVATESTGGNVFDMCDGVSGALDLLSERILTQAGCTAP